MAEFNAALAYQKFNRPDKAIPLAKSALERAERSGELESIVLNGHLLANVHYRAADYPAAIQAARAALTADDGIFAAEDRGGLHLVIAQSYLALGNAAAATPHLTATEVDFAGKTDLLTTLYAVRGEWAALQEDTTAALIYYRQGLTFYPPTPGTAVNSPKLDSLRVDQYDQVIPLLIGAAESSSDVSLSLNYYDHLFDLVDRMRQSSQLTENQMFLSTFFRGNFDRAIALYGRQFEATGDESHLWEAFLLSERAKAYSLLAAFQDGRRARSDREIQLRRSIAELERGDSLQNSRQLAQLTLELSQVLRERADEDREVTIPSRETIEDHFAADGANILAFHVGKREGAAWLISPGASRPSVKWWRITAVDSLRPAVDRFRRALERSAYAGKNLRSSAEQAQLDAAFFAASDNLRALLFPRAIPEFGTGLTIIPDGPLTVFPFNCLPRDPAHEPVDYATVKYQFPGSLRYAYSLGMLAASTGAEPIDYDHDLLVMAPAFAGDAEGTNGTGAPPLNPLLYNQDEAEQISGLNNSANLLTDEKATRSSFLRYAGRTKILHLSSHGSVNISEPAFSFVAFTQRTAGLDPSELLYFNDLTGMKIPAELVVLSACETSLGRYVPGNHTMSLSSAFTAAGARSTLTSLWRVNDRATMELMTAFYEDLAAGRSRSKALHLAQERVRADTKYKHPYYWGAFTLYGADSTIDIGGRDARGDWIYGMLGMSLLGVVVVGAVIFGLLYLFRRRGS